jgi:hypothetical protein
LPIANFAIHRVIADCGIASFNLAIDQSMNAPIRLRNAPITRLTMNRPIGNRQSPMDP